MQSKTEWPKSAGIYKITCVSNGKIYIGKSINIDQRIKSHKYSEKNSGYHGRFQNAIKKYGWDSEILVLET